MILELETSSGPPDSFPDKPTNLSESFLNQHAQNRTGVKGWSPADLVVLDCEVVAGALEVGDLHEEAREHGLADVDVVLAAAEVGAAHPQIVPATPTINRK